MSKNLELTVRAGGKYVEVRWPEGAEKPKWTYNPTLVSGDVLYGRAKNLARWVEVEWPAEAWMPSLRFGPVTVAEMSELSNQPSNGKEDTPSWL